MSRLASHGFGDRVIFIITGRSRSRQPFVKVALAGNEILFSGVGWIATYIRLTPLDDLTATLIEVSIARDMNQRIALGYAAQSTAQRYERPRSNG